MSVGDLSPQAILRRLGKLRGRSATELRERAGQMLSAELEYRGFARTVGAVNPASLRPLLDERVLGTATHDADALRAHFAERASPPFFPGVRDGSSARALDEPRWATERAHLIAAADRILEGRYDLLGHEGLSYGHPIDWHLDPVSGRRAPMVHWSRIPYLDASIVGDHKVVWEINRHQQFMVLGRAWQVTGRSEYAREFAQQLESWMDANPPKLGINWASSLEVGYRAIAWVWALELFRDAKELSGTTLQRMLQHLDVHGRHLERYLSTYFSPNTHLTGEALSLLYLGVMLPELGRSSHWRERGWTILATEIERQVHPDGVYFEQATYYHRYTVDIFVHALLLARIAGMDVPHAMRERLSLAVQHLADITRPDHTIPIIGDDDGGQLVLLEERGFTDVRAALGTAAVLLERPDWARVAGGATEEVLWMLGAIGVQKVDAWAAAAASPSHESALFATGGYAVMRSGWDADAMHAVMDAGPLGAMNCGHAHSDALSIELWAGCPLVVDPGTYSYTGSPENRDAFRHSAAHNTVTIDGQSSSVSAGPFSWASRADARVEQWWTGTLTDRLVAEHEGFHRLADAATHRRTLMFVRGEYWVIADTVIAAGQHDVRAHFHFAPGITNSGRTPRSAWLDLPCAGRRTRLFFAVAGDVGPVVWDEGWISPSYGSRVLAPRAVVGGEGNGRRDLFAVLVPAGMGEQVTLEEVDAGAGRALVLNRPDRHDLLLFRTRAGVVHVAGVQMDADAALVRRQSAGGPVQAVALFGAAGTLTVDDFVIHVSGAAEARRTPSGWVVEGEGRVSSTS